MSCTVKELLDCADVNENSNWDFQIKLAKAQRKQYQMLIESGANDDDDVDEALEKYPDCKLNNLL